MFHTTVTHRLAAYPPAHYEADRIVDATDAYNNRVYDAIQIDRHNDTPLIVNLDFYDVTVSISRHI